PSLVLHLFSSIADLMLKFLNRISCLMMAEMKDTCTECGVDASKLTTAKVEKRPHPSTKMRDIMEQNL
uniref:GP-PDE domain-containing protein n=1 Tax=Parascaris univalens TaxID=6257 RepID=A0A914ZYA1_PARUN